MRTIIGGSRSVSDPLALEAAIAQSGFQITEVLTGNSRGVDEQAAAWALKYQIPCQVLSPQWSTYGGRAEQIRNAHMLSIADAVILVWDGFSRGTEQLITTAQDQRLPLFVYRCNPQEATRHPTARFYYKTEKDSP